MTSTAILLFAIAVAATFVQAVIGVGFALIIAPLAAIVQPDLLPGGLILITMPLNAWIGWRERHALDLLGLRWITAGRVFGAFVGLLLLLVISARGLNLLVGAATFLAVLASLRAPRFNPRPGAFATAGLVTGVTETATGIGGPSLSLVYQHAPPPTLRANVATCFLLGEFLSVALLVAIGSLGWHQVAAAARLLPAVVLGILLSGRARRRVDAHLLRKLVLGFAMIASVVLMLHG